MNKALLFQQSGSIAQKSTFTIFFRFQWVKVHTDGTGAYDDYTYTSKQKTMEHDNHHAGGGERAIVVNSGRTNALQGPSRGSNHCSENGVP
jgi:hypothetical protein